MGYVYIQSERPSADSDGLWTVGFYRPDGFWEPESDHRTGKDAAERVHWLNGGGPQPDQQARRQRDALLEQLEHAVRWHDQLGVHDIERFRDVIGSVTGERP